MVKRSLVSVVDDDKFMRGSLPDLLRVFGYTVQAFSSAEEFLASDFVGQTGCLILDVCMPGMSGPDLQRDLTFANMISQSSSLPLKEARASVPACWSKAPWSASRSRSAKRLYSKRSATLSKGAER